MKPLTREQELARRKHLKACTKLGRAMNNTTYRESKEDALVAENEYRGTLGLEPKRK